MSATDDRVLTGARWSAIARTGCARVGVYGAQDAPQDELPEHRHEELSRYFQRGLDIEDAHVRRLLEQHPDGLRQVEVPWPIRADLDAPIGVGHVDLYLPSERGVIEIVSTKDAALPEGKALQAAGYALNLPDAERAVVISVDPHTYRQHHYPLDLSGLEPRVRELEDGVVQGLAGDMPARVCSKPSDGIGIGCPFVTHCFEGWEPSPIDQLIGLDDELAKLADAEDAVAEAKQAKEDAEARREEIRDRLRPVLLAGEEYRGASERIKVKRIEFRTSGGFSMSAARKAGHTLPDELQAFVSGPGTRERWFVHRFTSEGKPE